MRPRPSSFRWFLIALAATLAAFAVPSETVRTVAGCAGIMLLPALLIVGLIDFLSEHNRRIAAGIEPTPWVRLALVPTRVLVGIFALVTAGIGAVMVVWLLYLSYQGGAPFLIATLLGLYATSHLFWGRLALTYSGHVLRVVFGSRVASFAEEGGDWMPTPAGVNWLCRTHDFLDPKEARAALPGTATLEWDGSLWSVGVELNGNLLTLQMCGGRRGPHAAAARLAAELPRRWPEIAPKVLREAVAVQQAFGHEDALDQARSEHHATEHSQPEPNHAQRSRSPLALRRITVSAGEHHPDAVALAIQFSFEAPIAESGEESFEAVDVYVSDWLVCSYLPIRAA